MSAPTRRRNVPRVPVRKAEAYDSYTRTPPQIEEALDAQGMNQTTNLGPGTPLRPYQGYSVSPRITDYPVGVNISVRTRQSWNRMSFDSLKAIIDAYDVARMCINHKIDELKSMEPMYVPIDSFRGDAEAAVDAARAVMEFPDRVNPFDEWLGMLMEGALRYDATALYHRRQMDGEAYGYEVLDATTIYPYIDGHGRRPAPPAPAYYQLIKGMPWADYTTQDIDYPRFRPQQDNPYGMSPMESLLLTANTDIRFQWHFMQMFTEGSVPAGFVELPPDISSPDQVAEWQDYWDAMILGDQAKLHQLIAVPNGTKIIDTKPTAFESAFPEYLMIRTCGAYGVVPQDLGLIKDVNRANGETQVDVQFRVNTLPWVRWVEGIVSRYLRYTMKLPVKMLLDTGRDKEDRKAEAESWGIYIDKGMASPDEGRQKLLGLPVDNERPVPRFYADPRTGPIPLGNIELIAGRIDPETLAPVDDQPLDETPYEGAGGVLPDKAPGGTQFKRAPINPDEPRFPQLEKPVPGSDVLGTRPGTPVIGDANPSGVPGEEKPVGKAADEMTAFLRFAKARERAGKWRDFRFEHTPAAIGEALNAYHRERVTKAVAKAGDDADEASHGCPHGDPTCPCQDGDSCHYEDIPGYPAMACAHCGTTAATVAGLAVQAVDTGRVLMLQRSLNPTVCGCGEPIAMQPGEDWLSHLDGSIGCEQLPKADPAAGCWEFPGGHVEDNETPDEAAAREWQEETGITLPSGTWGSSWRSGIYQGFVYTIASESDLPLLERDAWTNPDDPDGDLVESIAWWAPAQLEGNPAVRSELAASLPSVLDALNAAHGAVLAGVMKAHPAWYSHPTRHVEETLTEHYADAIRTALTSVITRDALRSAVATYVSNHGGSIIEKSA